MGERALLSNTRLTEATQLRLIRSHRFRSRGQILRKSRTPLWGLPETSLRPGFY